MTLDYQVAKVRRDKNRIEDIGSFAVNVTTYSEHLDILFKKIRDLEKRLAYMNKSRQDLIDKLAEIEGV